MAEVALHRERRAAGAAGPIYLLLFPFAVVLFLAALVTDITYSVSEFLMWLHFSQWLIAAGLAFGVLAATVLLIEFATTDAIRTQKSGRAHLALLLATLGVELVNSFAHTADGWTAVVPTGMALSIVGAILALTAVGALFSIPVTWVESRWARQ